VVVVVFAGVDGAGVVLAGVLVVAGAAALVAGAGAGAGAVAAGVADLAAGVVAAFVAAGVEVSAAVDLLERDFLEVVEASPVAVVEVVSAVAAFFDLEDFLVLEVSLAAVEESAVSDFFLDFEDFLVVEESAAESSAVFFFFDLDFVVVSLWSEDCVP
jgi:hypothetical protein